MHDVGNKHVAFDQNQLGFPSVKSCQAIVYHTAAGLFGYHDYKSAGGAEIDRKVAETFADWVRTEQAAHDGDGIALYGVINRRHQYGTNTTGMQDWESVLTKFADELGFDGPIYGIRITSHVKKDDSVYIVVTNAGPSCHVDFKRWSKMALDTTRNLDETSHGHIKKTSVYGADPTFDWEMLEDNEYITHNPAYRKDGKALNLNRVPTKKYHVFR